MPRADDSEGVHDLVLELYPAIVDAFKSRGLYPEDMLVLCAFIMAGLEVPFRMQCARVEKCLQLLHQTLGPVPALQGQRMPKGGKA